MDWMLYARMDWGVYHDPTRIAVYVEQEKITPEQYKEITGLDYAAT